MDCVLSLAMVKYVSWRFMDEMPNLREAFEFIFALFRLPSNETSPRAAVRLARPFPRSCLGGLSGRAAAPGRPYGEGGPAVCPGGAGIVGKRP